MDSVERVLSEIKNDDEIMRPRFTGLVDDVANILEKYGFGVTKVFLLEKQGHKGLEEQAKALQKALERIESYPDISADRKTARLIIKSIGVLKSGRRR